jgi:hypothetical protein
VIALAIAMEIEVTRKMRHSLGRKAEKILKGSGNG